jgi:microcystin-dependent protein
MAYEVNFTDSVNKGSITVEDNTVNTDTSLQLPGRNLSDFGNIVLENFLHLLENFANTTSPENPVEGQLWYDTTDGIDQLKVYDGTQWVSAGGLKKATTEPEASTSTIGDLWVDTANQQVYLYSGSGWILVGPDYSEGASTGSKFVTVTSTTNQEIPVIINYVSDIPVSIISSVEFIPKAVIQGYSTIYPGINISGNIGGQAAKYYGLAEKAENLVISNTNVPGTDFVRKSTENILSRTLRIRNNGGLDIGETQTLVFSVSGSVGEISHKASDGSIDFKVNNAGVSTTAIRVYNDTKVAIGSPTKIPTEALDVVGNIVASGTLTLGGTTESTTISNGALIVPGGAGIAKNLNVGGNIDLEGSLTVNGNILPETTGKNIGSSLSRFNNVYATNFYGTFVGSLTGNVTGSSTTTGRLNSPTTFVMTGDITAPSFVFDGQTGGTTKTFTTTLSDSYFTSKTLISTIDSTDQIVIRRLAGADIGLKRVSQETLTSKIPNTAVGPVIPVGSIMSYAGTTAPPGWFICDGTEKSKVSYAALFTAIGTNFGAGSSTAFFKIPDLRGRFLLGHKADAVSGNRVLQDIASESVGQYGGSESDFIIENQLPEHKHSLMGDDGTQFYATTNVTGVADGGSSSVSIVGGDPGSGLTRTEGIYNYTSQIEFTTVPPFATVTYIIYHGVF